MKIIYFHQYFITPEEAGGARSYYISKALIESGHEVVMVSSQNNGQKLIEKKNIDGIKVIYILTPYSSRMSTIQRLFTYIKFMLYSSLIALKENNIDIVYATSTPISIGIPGLISKMRNRCKFVFEVRDIWPDVPYEMGYIKNRLLYLIMKRFESLLYNSANTIVSISEGIKQKIGPPNQDKTVVFPFGANLKQFNLDKDKKWKTDHGILEKTLYVFTGAIGLANDVTYLVEAARLLKINKDEGIFIAIIGDGSGKKQVEALIKKYNLTNIRLFQPVPINQLAEIYHSADAGVILFGKKSKSYRFTASPNKFFDYIAAGLPFFFNFTGPLKSKVIDANVGHYVNHNKPEELCDVMKHYSVNLDKLRQMGANARLLAEREYDRDEIFTKLVSTVTQPAHKE